MPKCDNNRYVLGLLLVIILVCDVHSQPLESIEGLPVIRGGKQDSDLRT